MGGGGGIKSRMKQMTIVRRLDDDGEGNCDRPRRVTDCDGVGLGVLKWLWRTSKSTHKEMKKSPSGKSPFRSKSSATTSHLQGIV